MDMCSVYNIYMPYIFQNVETNRLIFLQTIRQSSNRQETWGPIPIKQTNKQTPNPTPPHLSQVVQEAYLD